MSNRKSLIIGGAGYIGLAISNKLLEEGHEVIVADNLIYGHGYALKPFLLNKKFSFVNFDYTKESIKDSTLLNGVENVILLAGLVGDPITKKYPNYASKVNGEKLRNIFDDLDKSEVKKLIFTSTCSNYGLIEDNEMADENHTLNPLSLYAKEKVKAEEYLIANADAMSYESIILRFSTAFGCAPRMRFDLSVNEFVRDIFLKKKLEVYDPDTWRPYCHVRDFGNLISKVLDNQEILRGEVFNAGSDQNNLTKRMIVESILKLIPSGKVDFVEGGLDKRNYRVDFSKVKKHFSFETEWTVEMGVEELISNLKKGLFIESDNNPNYFGNYFLEGKD